MQKLTNAWYNKSPLLYLLAPIAWLYQAFAQLKRWLYTSGIIKTQRFSAPVIVVGNITVGGTGKTPLVIALAQLLLKHGYKPGIVSRGYGGKPSTLPLYVTPDTSPTEAGDETVLIAQRTGCPVVVSPNRVDAVNTLINTHHCNVILSDDGMQHYRMHRDIEIAVVDGDRRLGNALCLPAGPLREPISRLKHVDFIVSNGSALENEWSMSLIPDEIHLIKDPKQTLSLETAQQQPIHAVAGIGNPARFFKQLENMGFSVIPHPFSDHHPYISKDILFDDGKLVIMTEKDAVKCKPFAQAYHYCLPVKVQFNDKFSDKLLEKLRHYTRIYQ